MKKKILCVIGTRPEVIKMAPVIRLLKKDKEIELIVLSTAQHREMLDQMLELFEIIPDIDLNLMKKNQSLSELTANLPIPLDLTMLKEKPDIVLGQGDTTTAFMVSLACYYQKIPFGHVEAGLRSGNLYNPFPEEMNRVIISRLSTLNFAPTEQAKQNLIKEGYDPAGIYLTGNTVIDALQTILEKGSKLDPRINKDARLILVTAHRRENFDEHILEICRALKALADKNKDIQILYPVHPNPNIYNVVYKELSGHPRILLTDPLDYKQFITTMKHSYLILSDSGGIQEEAPTLGVPVLVLRENTERPEAIEEGAAKLVGTDSEKIIETTQKLLDDTGAYRKMIVGTSPYGDGMAAKRIIDIVKNYLNSGNQ